MPRTIVEVPPGLGHLFERDHFKNFSEYFLGSFLVEAVPTGSFKVFDVLIGDPAVANHSEVPVWEFGLEPPDVQMVLIKLRQKF